VLASSSSAPMFERPLAWPSLALGTDVGFCLHISGGKPSDARSSVASMGSVFELQLGCRRTVNLHLHGLIVVMSAGD